MAWFKRNLFAISPSNLLQLEKKMTDKKYPSPEEIQSEFEDFVKKRFGGNVQVFTSNVNNGSDKNRNEKIEEPEDTSDETFLPEFSKTPKEIKEYLDRYIIGQDEAKKALAIAVCDHYNHIRDHLTDNDDLGEEYSKQNVLILGPTGVGKTYLVRKIAELIGVPFIKADATRFSETGYVGSNVDDLVRDLVTQADGDIEKAKFGIVYLDEADKIATPGKNQIGKDVNGRGVQFGLLRLMEDTDVDLQAGNDMQSQMQAIMDMQKNGKISKKIVNTRYILFIVSGAFSGLEEIITKRMATNTIGFNTDDKVEIEDQAKIFSHAVTKDFIDFGFEPEFIGRLPVRVSCNNLTQEDLYKILLDSKGSIIRQYKSAFKGYNIDLEFDEESLHEISKLAYQEKTGARALLTVCEKTLREFKYHLPSSFVKKLVVTKEMVHSPLKELNNLLRKEDNSKLLLKCNQIAEYETYYKNQFELDISFGDDAKWKMAQISIDEKKEIKELCKELLDSYEHGLKLIERNTGKNKFKFDEDMIKNPKDYLDQMIMNSYPNK